MFHAASPGLVASASGVRKGYGLSLFMAGGGIGRSLGPLLVVWVVSVWGLSSIYRLMFMGWAVSLILFIQFRKLDFTPQKNSPLKSAFLYGSLRRSTLDCGAALTVQEISGVIGALFMGPISDNFGRRKIIKISLLISAFLVPVLLQVQGLLVFPVLVLLGFFGLSPGTIFLALVQDNFQEHRATGNGVYLLISFLSNGLMLIIIGFIGDNLGLKTAYLIGAAASLCSIPALALLPQNKNS